MRLNVVFLEGLQPQNVLIMFLFSIKHSYLLTAKITQDVNNSLWFLHGMIMASTRLVQYVYVTSLFCKQNLQEISIIVILIFCLNSLTECPKLALIYYQFWVSLLLKRLFLLKKFILKLITNLFKAWFSTWKKKLLIVTSCRCPD